LTSRCGPIKPEEGQLPEWNGDCSGPQTQSGCFAEKKKLLVHVGDQIPFLRSLSPQDSHYNYRKTLTRKFSLQGFSKFLLKTSADETLKTIQCLLACINCCILQPHWKTLCL